MSMKVKLNRGPANGQRYVQPDHTYQMVIQQPRKGSMYDMYKPGHTPQTTDVYYQTGTYYKSNVTLKDGTVVFEWMGWRD